MKFLHSSIFTGTKDYQRQSNIVIVPADTRSTTFTINIINDDVSECDESFKLALSVPSSTCGVVSGGTNTTEVTIKDDNGRRSVSSCVVLFIY